MRIVLDTNIVVSACLPPGGSSATIVELVLAGRFSLCLSEEVLAEYRLVLARPKFAREADRAAIVLDALVETAHRVDPEGVLSVCGEDEDNRLVECASAGGAEFLVTGNLKDFPLGSAIPAS